MTSDNNIQLPSNRKFGSFFCVVFGIAGFYFLFEGSNWISLTCFLTSLLILIITLLKAELLLIPNRLWMKFGFLLSIIVSPIVLGFMFFFLFTPISVVQKIFRRDELILKFGRKDTMWSTKGQGVVKRDSFEKQF